ncbi:MAG: Smr/MutS family protein [Gemmatimonadaceae bacterium]|nr:Smr/MutS family protein [Gemmatimonadaceae bacterium]
MPSGGKRRAAPVVIPIERAFDELRFGAARTLNLRDGLPTVAQAEARVESWLRRQQAEGGGEVLVITGRGLGSLDGVGRVREAVLRRCTALKRLNVVVEVREHGPGAVVVTVAPLRALVDAPRLRTGRKDPTPVADPAELAALPAEIRALLRALADITIQRLGVRDPSDAMIADEMLAQFGALAPSVVMAPDRVRALRDVAERLLLELREEP